MSKKLSDITLEELWKLFPIVLEEYNPEWKEWYEEEEENLVSLIGSDYIERISHIGSTSVRGLLAKPIVDILLEISADCDLTKFIYILEKNGYILSRQPDNPEPHMMFMKGYAEAGFEKKVFHLHVRYLGDWDELYFRDYLRLHGDKACEYAELKKKLKDRYEHDRDAYTRGKTDFVKKHTEIARAQFGDRHYKLNRTNMEENYI